MVLSVKPDHITTLDECLHTVFLQIRVGPFSILQFIMFLLDIPAYRTSYITPSIQSQ
jgi:hypothetical protein